MEFDCESVRSDLSSLSFVSLPRPSAGKPSKNPLIDRLSYAIQKEQMSVAHLKAELDAVNSTKFSEKNSIFQKLDIESDRQSRVKSLEKHIAKKEANCFLLQDSLNYIETLEIALVLAKGGKLLDETSSIEGSSDSDQEFAALRIPVQLKYQVPTPVVETSTKRTNSSFFSRFSCMRGEQDDFDEIPLQENLVSKKL